MKSLCKSRKQRARFVLVGTDLGPAADEAVRQADRWCLDEQDRLVVCHVVPSPIRLNLLFPQLNVDVTQHVFELQRISELVERRVTRVTGRSGRDFQVVVEDGIPEDVLVRRAEEQEAELVVVGGSSDSALGRLLGGVAERVVRHAPGPVLVAREPGIAGSVLVATDFSDPSFPAVAAGVAEAQRRRARLHVVHCLPLGAELAALHQRTKRRMQGALDRFSASAELHVVPGEPGSAITSLAEELQPELLVLGTAGHTGLRRLVLGSVAEFVVRYARQSTLVVRLRTYRPQPTTERKWLHAS